MDEGRQQRRKKAADKGVDATRVQRLSVEQLQHLRDQLGDHKVETHGVIDSHFWCHRTTRSLNAQGYPNNVAVGVKRQRGEWDNDEFRPDFAFVATQVVLAYEGIFADSTLDEASHLCHNRWCIRPLHIVWESRTKNENRKNCPGDVVCQCGDHRLLCVHTPKCIKLNVPA